MDELKVQGIVLSSIDYKEKDKLITIFSLELGKLTALLKGVKNPNAKMKFASLPFCYAEFVMVKTGNNLTVKECNLIESFYELTSDYDRLRVGACVLETTNVLMQPNTISEKYFINILKYLKGIAFSQTNMYLLANHFFLHILKLNGYEMNFVNCSECGCKFVGDVFLNLSTGALSCVACRGNHFIKLEHRQFTFLKILNQTPLDKINSIKLSDNYFAEGLLHILIQEFNSLFNCKLQSI